MSPAPDLRAALACNLDADILTAALPLLEAGEVQGLEWSFDALYAAGPLPEWFTQLLHAYGQEGRLVGHGVFFSLLSGRWAPEQQQWLQQLARMATEFRFDHITEHFGFFTGQNFHHGAPLPVPYSRATLRLGQDRLQRIAEACRCPVGLENLAFAYSLDEVERHGDFLAELLAPVNGFLILDLHNLYCQLHNFQVPAAALLARYPLERVREIHISGGSWEASGLLPERPIRRDTHDDAVPEAVFELLALTLPRCPNLRYVVLEQLGGALRTEESRAQYRQDFRRMAALVEQHRAQPRQHAAAATFEPPTLPPAGPAPEDAALYAQQRQLADILETALDYPEARRRLQASALAGTDWRIEDWTPHMLETAVSIARKWKE